MGSCVARTDNGEYDDAMGDRKKTRFRGEDEPSRLDLVFTGEADVIGDVTYTSPLGKSDHVLIELDILEGGVDGKDEELRENRLNYERADFRNLRKFFWGYRLEGAGGCGECTEEVRYI